MTKKKGKNSDFDRLVKNVSAIIEKFQPFLKRAEKLGIFLGDRDLLECKKCGLQEDVKSDGVLIVAKRRRPALDTGLRFKELKNKPNNFRCPGCRDLVRIKER